MEADLTIAYRLFPQKSIHENAEHAAKMAEAAAQHAKFWPMHDLLFEHQDALEDVDLIGYAEILGIDPKWAAAALADGRFEPRVREDFSSGVRSGVNGTPTFFINGQRYDGPVDLLLETLRQALISPSAH